MPFYSTAAAAAVTTKPAEFLPDSSVSPAVAGEPTLAEAQVAITAAGLSSQIAYYNATDVDDKATVTFAYAVDSNGDAVEIEEEGTGGGLIDQDYGDITVSGTGTAMSIDDNTIDTVKIQDDAVTTAKIVDDAVTTAKIVDANVTTAKIADDAVTLDKLAGGTAGKYIGFDGSGDPVELDAALANPTVHADETTVAPASAGDPTTVEIAAFAAAGPHTDVVLEYTGTDTASDPVTHAYYVDSAGSVTVLEKPAATGLTLADAIPPASDDATGAIGASGDVAREDHKHPSQAPSADANNAIVVGTDGLHHAPIAQPADLTAGNAGQMIDASHYKALDDKIDGLGTVEHEAADITARDALADLVIGDRVFVTDASADASVDSGWAVYRWDGSTFLKLAEAESLDLVLAGKDRVHADDTTVAPASAGEPTVSEIATFATAGSHNDTVIYYTGSDTPGDDPTHVYHVDESGSVTLLLGPGDGEMTGATSTVVGAGGTVPAPAIGDHEAFLRGDGTWEEIDNRTRADIAMADSATVAIPLLDNSHVNIVPDAGATTGAFSSVSNGADGQQWSMRLNGGDSGMTYSFGSLWVDGSGGQLSDVTIAAGDKEELWFFRDGSDNVLIHSTLSVGASLYDGDGTLAGARTVSLDGNNLLLSTTGGLADVTFSDTNAPASELGWDTEQKTTVWADVNIEFGGFDDSRNQLIQLTNATATNLQFNHQIGGKGTRQTIVVSNFDTVDRTVEFPTGVHGVKKSDGTDLGDVVLAPAQTMVFDLQRVSASSHAWYYINEPVAGSLNDNLLTASLNNVDLTAGNHDRVDSTSGMTVLDTVNLPAAPAVGDYGEFYNGSAVALVLTKDAGDTFLGNPSTAIPASSGFSWRCVAANTIEVIGTGEAGGGLIARGVANSDTDLGPGIYSMDASAAAFDFTLPAASGSQARYMLLGADVSTNYATVKVQAGESMNSSTDLAYTMSVDDEVVLFIDEEVGNWSAQVVGASTSESLAYGRMRSVSVPGTNDSLAEMRPMTFDTVDNAFNITADGASGLFTATQAGRYRVDVSFSGDDSTVDDWGLFAVVNGVMDVANIMCSHDNDAGSDATSIAGGVEVDLAVGDTLAVWAGQTNTGASVGDNLAQVGNSRFVNIRQVPVSETVLAGHVVPTELNNFSQALAADVGGTSSEVDLGISYTIPETGRYLVSVYGRLLVAGDDVFSYVKATDASDVGYDGLEYRVESQDTSRSSSYNEEHRGSATAILDLTAGDVVKLRGDEGGNGDILAGTSLTVQQMPTSTVVNPGTVPVESLHWARMANNTNFGAVVGTAISPFDIDGVENTGATTNLATGEITIAQDGVYNISGYAGNRSSAGDNQISVYKNGSLLIEGPRINPGSAGNPDTYVVEDVVSLTAGDVITLVPTAVSGNSWDGAELVVKQIASKTITALNPAFTEAKDLAVGSVSATADQTFTTAAWVDHSELQLTLPNIGRYRLDADLLGRHSSPGSAWHARIVDASGNVIDNARTGVNTGTASNQMHAGVSGFVTTTAANQLVKIQVWGNAATATIEGNTLPDVGTSKFAYQQLPSTEYVTPGDVPVEDLRTLIGSYSGNNGVQTVLSGGQSWDDVKAIYESFLFIGGGNDSSFLSAQIDADQIDDGHEVRFWSSDSAGNWQLRASFPDTTNGTMDISSSNWSTIQMRVYGIKAQKTVINTTDVPVNDQTTSGFMDIGTMRIAWGSGTTSSSGVVPVVFPGGGFASAPSVTTAAGDFDTRVVYKNLTATTVDIAGQPGTANGFKADPYSYVAIGLKP